jgi:hypothetical protein
VGVGRMRLSDICLWLPTNVSRFMCVFPVQSGRRLVDVVEDETISQALNLGAGRTAHQALLYAANRRKALL